MSDRSAIEWTDATWNVLTGCTKVSPGCASCYIARTMPFRTKGRKFERVGNAMTTGLLFHPERLRWLDTPKWAEPRRIFVNSLSDLWHEEVPFEFVDEVFDTMNRHRRHTFQLLTKRPERMLEWWQRGGTKLWEHVWLGVSVENARYTWRAEVLKQVPAAVRFISAEPLLGSLYEGVPPPEQEWTEQKIGDGKFKRWLNLDGLDWVICGGESGPGFRPLDVEHARELRDACENAGVAFFFKQVGGAVAKAGGKVLDGREHCEFPTDQIGVPDRYLALA